MDGVIRTFEPGSYEYRRLQLAADVLSMFTGLEVRVGETYYDYGQRWKWTTLLVKRPGGSEVQAFSPREQEKALAGTYHVFANLMRQKIHELE